MTRTRKVLFTGVFALAGVCVLLLLAGVIVLRSVWFKDQVRQRIIREVEAATGGRAEIGDFQFDMNRMQAEVRSFVLHGTEPPGEPPLFRADSVRVGLKIVSILRRDVNIASLTVAQPRLRIVIQPDGRTNLPQPRVVRQHKNPIEQMLALSIGRYEIQRGFLEINERRIPVDVRGEDLDARLFFEAAGPRYTGDVSFKRLTLASPSILPVAMDANVSLGLESDRLVIRKARLATGRSSADVNGVVENLLSPKVRLSVNAALWLAEIQSLAKLPPAVRGVIRLAGEFSFAGRSDYRLSVQVSGAGLSAKIAGMEFRDIRNISARAEASPERIGLTGISVAALGGAFSGNAAFERSGRFHVSGEVRDASILELASLRGMKAPPWNGSASGAVSVDGVWVGGAPSGVKLGAQLKIAPADAQRPLEGFVGVTFDQKAGVLEFADSHLATSLTRLQFSGTLNRSLQVDFESKNLEDVLPAASLITTGSPPPLPIVLRNGTARFQGSVAGNLADPRVSGHVSLTNFAVENRLFDRLEADGILSKSSVEAGKLMVNQGGATVEGHGRVALENWKPVDASRIEGAFNLRGLPLERVAAEAGAKIAVRGDISATLQAAGTIGAPQFQASLSLAQGEAFGQRLDKASARVRYASQVLSVESLDLNSGKTRLHGNGEFAHRQGDLRSGNLRFALTASDVSLKDLRSPAHLPEQMDGVVDAQARGAASVANAKLRLNDLQGEIHVREAAYAGHVAGGFQLTARTNGENLTVDGTGELAGSKVSGQARCALKGNYPFQGELRFSSTSLTALRPWLTSGGGAPPAFEASAAGSVSFQGAALDPASWSARVEVPTLEIRPPPGLKSPVPGLRNAGLIALAISRKEVRILGAHFSGLGTDVDASGRIDLASRFTAYDIRLRGAINLGILSTLDPNLTAAGASSVDASIRGTWSRPEIYGRLDLRKASLYLSNVPNGLDNVNGVVFLFRDRATIENLTAETGGGKLTLKGFVGFGQGSLSYRLQAAADNVRIRYPQGVSTSADASLDLTGTAERSLLSGSVTILRCAVSANTDLASLLARSSQPMVTPATQNELLRGMQFDVKVETAANARFDTTLTRDIQAHAEMRLRGTPYKPVLLGRASISGGEINFMGNRYTITRGDVSFLNPVKLEPVLDLDLSTRVRGIDVTMNFTGPLDRLNMTYRSDPPLQAQEIFALLAVGRAPTSDPALLARQSERDQSWQQLGASTLVGQALATPVTNRLQRFFGVSRIKIDPQLTGTGNYPEAQLTLEQQISRDITFTYVTSLAQEQQQLIQVQWNVSRQWSVQAVRQENGLFGIQFQYRRQFK